MRFINRQREAIRCMHAGIQPQYSESNSKVLTHRFFFCRTLAREL